MNAAAAFVTLAEVAERAAVRRSAVSNWRNRFRDFPRPRVVAGQEVFDAVEIGAWLSERRIPQNRLNPGEAPGTSYGDRFLGDPAPAAEPAAAVPPAGEDQTAPLWQAMDVLRGAHDRRSSLELLLGLVYVKVRLPEKWADVLNAADWQRASEVLAQIRLPVLPGTPPIPVLPSLASIADDHLLDVVGQVERIEIGAETSLGSPGALLGEALLGELERDLGRGGGHFTPPDVVACLVGLLDPAPQDSIYDPFCGSGELLVAAVRHAESTGGTDLRPTVCGQTSNSWSWLTTRMNLELHGIEHQLGPVANALVEDGFSGERFSRILANPAFNQRVDVDQTRSWPFGAPAMRNANLAWLQHAAAKLKPHGRAAVIMLHGPAFVQNGSEAAIRRKMVEAGVVECVIALPRQLFRFTAIPTMVWILRSVNAKAPDGQVLMINAGELGALTDRTKRTLGADDIAKVVDTYRHWRQQRECVDSAFARSVDLVEIRGNDHDLSPIRYTGAAGAGSVGEAEPTLGKVRTLADTLLQDVVRQHAELSRELDAVVGLTTRSRDGKTVSLGELCDVLSGPGKVEPANSPGPPLVLPRNIRGIQVDHGDLGRITKAEANRMSRYLLRSGDVVGIRSGSLGRYGLVKPHQDGWFLGPGCLRLRPTDDVDPEYLTYYLASPAAGQWLAAHSSGSVVDHVTAATMRRMPVWLPPPSAQRALVAAMRPIDAVAELHSRLHEVTAEMKKAVAAAVMTSTDAR
jgi:type I restriction enzyme M protein